MLIFVDSVKNEENSRGIEAGGHFCRLSAVGAACVGLPGSLGMLTGLWSLPRGSQSFLIGVSFYMAQHLLFIYTYIIYIYLYLQLLLLISLPVMGRKHKLEKEEPGSGAMTSIVTAKKSKPMKSRKKHHSDSEDSDVEMAKGVCFLL